MATSHMTRSQMERRRLRAAQWLMEGRLSQSEIGRRLGVSRAAVSLWAGQLKSGGPGGLRRRKPDGRPSRLRPSQRRRLSGALKRGALVAGFETNRWTLERIQEVIRRRFGIVYHPKYIGRLMRRLGWDFQRPGGRTRRATNVAGVWVQR